MHIPMHVPNSDPIMNLFDITEGLTLTQSQALEECNQSLHTTKHTVSAPEEAVVFSTQVLCC